MRVDKALVEQGYFSTRNKAADAIKAGRVFINRKAVEKASYNLKEEDEIEIREEKSYVSRSGAKLQAAFDTFGFSIEDQIVLDIGASTGGFSQVCLEQKAKKVYALDVGHLQLSDELKSNPKLVNMEGHNAREIKASWFDEPVDFVCCDVSFIPCRMVLEPAIQELKPEHLCVLIKPQFESRKSHLNKQGVLKDPKERKEIIEEIGHFLEGYYQSVKVMDSPLAGRKGNLEALAYASNRRLVHK